MVHHILHIAMAAAIVLTTAAAPLITAVDDARDAAPLDGVAVDRYIMEYLDRTGLPGAAVAVTRGTEIVRVAGYGHDSNGEPITAHSPLPIASVSKPFTALAVMQLVERGEVDLDAPVRDYLPDFALQDPRSTQITIRHLLTHRSGLSDQTFPEKSLPQPDTLAAAVTRLRSAELASAPGAAFHYHNPNYQVAARVVEVVSGEPFAVYLERHVFGPLGMNASTTVGDLRDGPDVARGHIGLYGGSVAVPEPYWFLDGGAGVVTTAEDLARALMLFTNAGRAADGTQIISSAGLDTLLTPAVSGEDDALGWSVDTPDDDPLQIGKSGWMFTFTADMVLVPDSGYGIAVVANRGLRLAPADAEAITEGLIALTQGGHRVDPPAPVGLIVDAVLGTLTLATLVVGVRAVARSRSWARRRVDCRVWWSACRLLPWLVPMVLLVTLRSVLGWVFGGRDGTWIQVVYVGPTLVLWLAVAAVTGIAVVGARSMQLRHALQSHDEGGHHGSLVDPATSRTNHDAR